MAGTEVKRLDRMAYREALPERARGGLPAVLMLHGYPESSYVWRHALPAAAKVGYRALAPDLPGFGDSPADLPGTWERQMEAVERFRRALAIERLILVVRDWGALIGLRWGCEHPHAVAGLVISNSGFFPDGKWHGLAAALQTEGEGEKLLEGLDRQGFGAVMRQSSPNMPDDAIDEFWKAFADADRRRAQLDLYRSGDFAKLEAYEGCLGALGVPALVLWGAADEFAPLAGARRLEREIPDAELVVLEEAGHFLPEDEPERTAGEIGRFLRVIAGEANGRPGRG